MKLKLEEKNNKIIVGLFPGVLDEVRNNIRDIRGENASIIAPNEDEQKVIAANEKYAKLVEDVLWFGEDALNILQNCRSEITDASAILYVIKGFTIYVNNRFNELDRVRKEIAGEQFYYYNDDGQAAIIGLNTKTDNDDEIEDLSYTYNSLYSHKDLNADIAKTTVNNNKATNWILQMLKEERTKKLSEQNRDRFLDLVANADLINRSFDMINPLLKTSLDKEQYKICQSLFMNFNSFIERAYMDCWAFRVNNNL